MTGPWWAAPPATDVDISVVIPAFNEADRIGPTLRDVVAHCRDRGLRFEIVVVDDGSTDQTVSAVAAIAEEVAGLRVESLEANRGKGHAVRQGVLATGGPLVVFLDADGATPIGELDRLIEAISSGAGIAIGSRVGRGDGIERDTKIHRRVMGRVFHTIVRVLVPSDVRDTQCGFKLFTRPVVREVFALVQADGYGFDVEVLGLASRAGVPIAELPVSWTDVPTSRVRLVRDSVAMILEIIAIRRRLRRLAWHGPAAGA